MYEPILLDEKLGKLKKDEKLLHFFTRNNIQK